MTKKSVTRRFLSLVLVFAMVFGLVPSSLTVKAANANFKIALMTKNGTTWTVDESTKGDELWVPVINDDEEQQMRVKFFPDGQAMDIPEFDGINLVEDSNNEYTLDTWNVGDYAITCGSETVTIKVYGLMTYNVDEKDEDGEKIYNVWCNAGSLTQEELLQLGETPKFGDSDAGGDWQEMLKYFVYRNKSNQLIPVTAEKLSVVSGDGSPVKDDDYSMTDVAGQFVQINSNTQGEYMLQYKEGNDVIAKMRSCIRHPRIFFYNFEPQTDDIPDEWHRVIYTENKKTIYAKTNLADDEAAKNLVFKVGWREDNVDKTVFGSLKKESSTWSLTTVDSAPLPFNIDTSKIEPDSSNNISSFELEMTGDYSFNVEFKTGDESAFDDNSYLTYVDFDYVEPGLVARMPYNIIYNENDDTIKEVEIDDGCDYEKDIEQRYDQYDFIDFGLMSETREVIELDDVNISNLKIYKENGTTPASGDAEIEKVECGGETYYRIAANVGEYILKYEDANSDYNGSQIRFCQQEDQFEIYEGEPETVRRRFDDSCRDRHIIMNGTEDKTFTLFFTHYDDQSYNPAKLAIYRNAWDEEKGKEGTFQTDEDDPDSWLIPLNDNRITFAKNETVSGEAFDVYTITVDKEFDDDYWIHVGTNITGPNEKNKVETWWSDCNFGVRRVYPGLNFKWADNDDDNWYGETSMDVDWYGDEDDPPAFKFNLVDDNGDLDDVEWEDVVIGAYENETAQTPVITGDYRGGNGYSFDTNELKAGTYILKAKQGDTVLGSVELRVNPWSGSWYIKDDISRKIDMSWACTYILKSDGIDKDTMNPVQFEADGSITEMLSVFEENQGLTLVLHESDEPKNLKFSYSYAYESEPKNPVSLATPVPTNVNGYLYYTFSAEDLKKAYEGRHGSFYITATFTRKAHYNDYGELEEDDDVKATLDESKRVSVEATTSMRHFYRKHYKEKGFFTTSKYYTGFFMTKEEADFGNWDWDGMLGITTPTYWCYGNTVQEVLDKLLAKAKESGSGIENTGYVNISSDGCTNGKGRNSNQVLDLGINQLKGIRLYSNDDNLWPDLTIKGQLADNGRVNVSGLWENRGANAATPKLILEKTVKADIYPMLGADIMGGKDYMIQFPEAFENANYKLDDSIAKKDGQKIIVKKNQAYASVVSPGFTIYYGMPEEKVPTITGIKVAQNPLKLEYTEGETFDPSGLIITYVYDDGHTEGSISTGYTVDKTGPLALTDNEVTITYNGCSIKLAIMVKAKPVLAQDVGTRVEATDAKGTFTVIDKGTGENSEPEVAFTKPAKSEAKVKIPATIKDANGVEYKVTVVAASAFKNDKKLTQIIIPETVETIGKNAFSGCKKLTTVKLGKNVEKIEQNAFANCTKLKKVEVTKSVTVIGKGAFNGCKKLKTVTITSTKVTKIEKNAFKGIDKKATIKVPKKMLKQYKKMLKKAGFKGTVKGK